MANDWQERRHLVLLLWGFSLSFCLDNVVGTELRLGPGPGPGLEPRLKARQNAEGIHKMEGLWSPQTHVVHLHPLTGQQLTAIAGRQHHQETEDGRLIVSGLAAIKGLAAGLTTGLTATAAGTLLPGIFSRLGYLRTATTKDNDVDVVVEHNDEEDDEEDDEDKVTPLGSGSSASSTVGEKSPHPLCMITAAPDEEESTVNNDISGREAGTTPTVINCIVLVKKREGEDSLVLRPLSDGDDAKNSTANDEELVSPQTIQPLPPPWHLNPFANPWYGAVGPPPPISYFAPPYPYAGYALPVYRHSSSNWERTKRALRLTGTPLAHKFSASAGMGSLHGTEANAVDAALSQEEQEEDQQQEEDPEPPQEDRQSTVNEEDEIHSEIESNSNRVPHEPHEAHYPQIEYISNYPKVTYAHALPYPAPVYVPPLTTTAQRNHSDNLSKADAANERMPSFATDRSGTEPPAQEPTRTTRRTRTTTTTTTIHPDSMKRSSIILAESASWH